MLITTPSEQLENLILKKEATIGVVGLGYVGLPLIHAFTNAGFKTLGYDIDQTKIDKLNSGESYIGHIPSQWLESWLAGEQFLATSNPDDLEKADAILVCVPTPLTEAREPDLTFVVSTMQTISRSLRPGQLIVLESTTYPGTTRDVVLPELEKSGLEVSRDFFLAYSPEREDPGNKSYTATHIPKVIGGYDDTSLQLATQLYEKAVSEIVPVSSCEVAEACKILENTYRAVNIALVNELKVIYSRMGIDVWDVIDAAKTKPFGFSAFYPGPGLGGHCIPIDPFYLSWLARKYGLSTRFVELAGEVNTSMPQYVLQRLSESLNDHAKPIRGSKIAILGIAYKPDVDDARESPSFVLLKQLLEQGAEVSYNDPHVPALPKIRAHQFPEMLSNELTPEFLSEQDCVLIATDHSAYDYDFIVNHSQLVVDTRNATREVAMGREKIVKA